VKMRRRVGEPDAASQEGLSARGGQKPSPIRSYAPTVNIASAPSWAIRSHCIRIPERRRVPLLTGFLLPHMTFYRSEKIEGIVNTEKISPRLAAIGARRCDGTSAPDMAWARMNT